MAPWFSVTDVLVGSFLGPKYEVIFVLSTGHFIISPFIVAFPEDIVPEPEPIAVPVDGIVIVVPFPLIFSAPKSGLLK